MAAYVIVQINVTNSENYKEYLKNVTSIVEKYGGKYIVRGGKKELMEGKWDYERTVVVEFPDFKSGLNWYNCDDYKPIKEIRKNNSEGNCIIIEGS